MKRDLIGYMLSIILLSMYFQSVKVVATSLNDYEIFNMDESANFYVYEFEFNDKRYIGYQNKYNEEFFTIKSNCGEEINSDLFFPSISKDGKYITFTSSATNIIEEFNSNECYDIFNDMYSDCSNIYIYSVENKKSVIVKNGLEYLNGNSYVSKISGDGKNVVFESMASNNLVVDIKNACFEETINKCINIFKYNIATKSISLISTYGNNHGGNSNSISPSISHDGKYITFQSSASNLGVNNYDFSSCKNLDENNEIMCSYIYLVNTKNLEIDIISRNENVLFNDNNGNSIISSNGKYIVYESYATNIEEKFNYKQHLVLFNIETSKSKIISKSINSLNNRDSHLLNVSDDGKYVVYETNSTNLNESGKNCIYVYNINSYKTSYITMVDFKDVISNIDDDFLIYYDNNIRTLKLDIEPPFIEEGQKIYVIKDSKIKLEDKIKFDDNLSGKEEITINVLNNLIFNSVGEYDIEVTALDFFDNMSSTTIKLIVIEKDIEGPCFNDVKEIKILKGSSSLNLSSYIEAIDNVDGQTRIYIMDDGGLNLNVKGNYRVLLMSKDSSDNISYKEMKIIVYENFNFEYYYEIILILGLICVIIFSIIRVK